VSAASHRLGPRLVAGVTGHAHSTVWKVLRRHASSRPPRAPKEPANATSGPAQAICCTRTQRLLALRAPRTRRHRFSYVRNRSLRELLERRSIRHLRTDACRPRTNGKVERFQQTMAHEWAYGLAYRSHRHRNRALPHRLAYYGMS
jgi:Integrase core domain